MKKAAAFETAKNKLEDKYGGTTRQFAINPNELSRINLELIKINFNLIALDKQSMRRNRDLADTLVINLFDSGATEESDKVPHNIKVQIKITVTMQRYTYQRDTYLTKAIHRA